MTRIRLIAVDIDGTLLNLKGDVCAENILALRTAATMGVHIVLATARRGSLVQSVTRTLDCLPFTILCNGAVTCSPEGDEIDCNLLSARTVEGILEDLCRFSCFALVAYRSPAGEIFAVEEPTAMMGRLGHWLQLRPACVHPVRSLRSVLVDDPLQFQFAGTTRDMVEIHTALKQCVHFRKIAVLRTDFPGALSVLDVVPSTCNKGTALARLCSVLEVNSESVLAIGDNYNDREMLAFAGSSFIVRNAPPGMKTQGWKETLACHEAGVAHAIASVIPLP